MLLLRPTCGSAPAGNGQTIQQLWQSVDVDLAVRHSVEREGRAVVHWALEKHTSFAGENASTRFSAPTDRTNIVRNPGIWWLFRIDHFLYNSPPCLSLRYGPPTDGIHTTMPEPSAHVYAASLEAKYCAVVRIIMLLLNSKNWLSHGPLFTVQEKGLRRKSPSVFVLHCKLTVNQH